MNAAIYLVVAVVWLGVGSWGWGREVVVARGGRAEYVIGVRVGAAAVEKTAARELEGYLERVTGAGFEVREGVAEGKVIEVRVEEGMEADGVRMRVEGERIVLSGGVRGVIYAVHVFLEEVVGVRWWTSSEEFVPRRGTLVVRGFRAKDNAQHSTLNAQRSRGEGSESGVRSGENGNIEHSTSNIERRTGVGVVGGDHPTGRDVEGVWDVTYAPRIRYRENYNWDVVGRHPEFAVRMKLNGHHQAIPEEWGGHYSLIGWCHTSFDLVPPSEWFGRHPEWYAEREGKRQASQVCWSDEGMRREMARRVLGKIRRNPGAGMISVSQEDALGECRCAKCVAVEKEEGSAMGPLLRGVNAVAAEVEREFPGFLVETLAYQWSRKPPRVTRPGKNVLIRLCSIEGDFSRPLSGQDFGEDLRGWAKIADHLFVWNYVTNFSNYLIPQPNLKGIGADLRWFAENNVVGVFEQGDAFNGPVGDFLQLRVWVQAKLMWDPSQDQGALVREFLEGYYGAAGKPLGEYLELVNARSGEAGFRRGCYHPRADFMTGEMVARAAELFDRAEGAVRGDEVLLKRVRVQRLILEHVKLMRWDWGREVKEKGGERVSKEYGEAVERWVKGMRETGARNFSEMLGFEGYVGMLRAEVLRGVEVKLPEAGKVRAGQFDVQEDRLRLHRRGELAEIVEDPKASNGKAVRMRGGHTEWAVQCPVGKGIGVEGRGPWRCFVVVRGEGGSGFTVGVFSSKGHVFKGRREVGAAEAGEGYRVYGFVVEEVVEGDYVFVSPGGAGAVWVDRVVWERG